MTPELNDPGAGEPLNAEKVTLRVVVDYRASLHHENCSGGEGHPHRDCYCGTSWCDDMPKAPCAECEAVESVVAAAKAQAWDEAVQAVAWCLDNGEASPAAALAYVAENNPYRDRLNPPVQKGVGDDA